MRLSTTAVIWLSLAGSAVAQATQPPAVPAAAQEPAEPVVRWGAELDTSSRYIWHGLPFSTGVVVWPSAWVSTKGVTLTLWTNFDHRYVNTTPFNPQRLPGPTFNEYDISLAYEREVGHLTLTGTFSRYVYLEAKGVIPQSTSEVIARVAYAAGPGKMFTTHSFDVDKHRGAYYLETGYALERELHTKSTLKVDGSITFWSKFAEKYGITSDGPLGPATLNAALVQQLTPFIAVRPHVTFMRLLDGAARRELGTPGFTYGVALTFGY